MDIRLKELLAQLIPSFLAGMILLLLAVPVLWATAGFLPLVRLVLVGGAGALGYIVPLWFMERETMRKLFSTLGFLKVKKTTVAGLLLAATLLATQLISPRSALAQSPMETPTPTVAPVTAVAQKIATDLTLARLDYADIELRSPIDQQTYQYGLP